MFEFVTPSKIRSRGYSQFKLATKRTTWRGHEKTRMKKGLNDSHIAEMRTSRGRGTALLSAPSLLIILISMASSSGSGMVSRKGVPVLITAGFRLD